MLALGGGIIPGRALEFDLFVTTQGGPQIGLSFPHSVESKTSVRILRVTVFAGSEQWAQWTSGFQLPGLNRAQSCALGNCLLTPTRMLA